ncbi:MAG: GNAT family N-acetyltransferase, partial [Dehalococcoidia bacterium]
MSGEPAYRQVTKDDAKAIAAVAAAVLAEFGEASGLPGPMTPEAVADRLAGYGDKGAMFLCAVDEGVCGFAALEPDPQEDGCAVMGVWLLPSARRQGIGRELALMALEFARAAGYAKVRGTLPAGTQAALLFFREIGA